MRYPAPFQVGNQVKSLIYQAILLDNKLCRHPFCLRAEDRSRTTLVLDKAYIAKLSSRRKKGQLFQRAFLPESFPASAEQHCANVMFASSLLHLAASRLHFPGLSNFPWTHISYSNVLPGNLKIIQHKVEFYGEYKTPGYSLFMPRVTKRCKIIPI